MARTLLVIVALTLCLPAAATAVGPPAATAGAGLLLVADEDDEQGLEREAEDDDAGRTGVGRAPPSRGGAFAGGYMAATAVGTLWVANAAAWWGLVALSALAPPRPRILPVMTAKSLPKFWIGCANTALMSMKRWKSATWEVA